MGKRQLHGGVHYQCDWSGFAIPKVQCYLPTWRGDRLIKRGVYCNWESVVAHAYHIAEHGDPALPAFNLQRTLQYIKDVLHTLPNTAPHYTSLKHFTNGTDTYDYHSYLKHCERYTEPLVVIKCTPGSQQPTEIEIPPDDGGFDFAQHINLKSYLHPNHSLSSALTPVIEPVNIKAKLGKDKCVLLARYHTYDTGPYAANAVNALASQLTKTKVFGEALVLLAVNEACVHTRTRYVNLTKQDFMQNFQRKRKRGASELHSLCSKDYNELKSQMQLSLDGVEGQISLDAQQPHELAHAAVRPPMTGKELRRVAVEVLRLSPPPVRRQVAMASVNTTHIYTMPNIVTMTCMSMKKNFDVVDPPVTVLANGRYAYRAKCPWQRKDGADLYAFKFCSTDAHKDYLKRMESVATRDSGEESEEPKEQVDK
eukprot:2595042-Pleurochrysis_carterae.AAC.5